MPIASRTSRVVVLSATPCPPNRPPVLRAKVKRARDTQRSKLYRAEDQHSLRHVMQWGNNASIDFIQAYVTLVASRAWFVARWGKRQFECRPGRSSAHASSSRVMYFGVPSRNKWVALHELAHCLTWSNDPGHGREYARVFLELVTLAMGKAAGDELRQLFREHGVRYKTVSEAQRAAGRRLAEQAKAQGLGFKPGQRVAAKPASTAVVLERALERAAHLAIRAHVPAPSSTGPYLPE